MDGYNNFFFFLNQWSIGSEIVSINRAVGPAMLGWAFYHKAAVLVGPLFFFFNL